MLYLFKYFIVKALKRIIIESVISWNLYNLIYVL